MPKRQQADTFQSKRGAACNGSFQLSR